MTGTLEQGFGPADDDFHFRDLGEDWWATETSWFSFHDVERRLGGWLYTLARPNIGTVAGGAWVWDDTASLPWEVLYSRNYTSLQLPPDADLRSIRLPTGVSIDVVEPTMRYRLGYDDPGHLLVDLRFDALMAPRPASSHRSTFGAARHYDQIGRMSGSITLHGERVQIDCAAVRDRSWGRRREDRPHRAAYVTGASPSGDGFVMVTRHGGEGEELAYGFLRRHGREATLSRAERHVERDPETGRMTAISLVLEEEGGDVVRLDGRPLSLIIVNRHTFIDLNSLVSWRVDGADWVGEDQDMWPVHDWSEARRRMRADR